MSDLVARLSAKWATEEDAVKAKYSADAAALERVLAARTSELQAAHRASVLTLIAAEAAELDDLLRARQVQVEAIVNPKDWWRQWFGDATPVKKISKPNK